MVFLDENGNWLDGSGWADVFERAKITTTGCIESYYHSNKMKRTRHAYQASLASLILLSVLS